MNAMVLCAGYGTRLHPLTDSLPKPLVEIAGFRLLDDALAHLALQGVTMAVVNGSWLSGIIEEHLESRKGPPETIYQYEPEPLGTAGAVRRALPILGERFLVVYGDNLTRQPVAPLLDIHNYLGAEVTVALSPTGDPSSKGIVLTDPSGRVTSFREKPPSDTAGSNLSSSGILVCEASALSGIPDGTFSDFGRDILPGLLEEGRTLAADTPGGYTIDIGTLESYLLACHHVLSGRVRPLVGPDLPEDGRLVESPLPDDVELVGTAWIRWGVSIGGGSRMENCVILEGAKVGAGCTLRNTLVLPGNTVPSGTDSGDKYLTVL